MEWLLPQHEFEQMVVHRYFKPECQPCLERGCCINCGCNTYAKMLDSKATCANGWWYPMHNKEVHKKWKENFEIQIKVTKKNGTL